MKKSPVWPIVCFDPTSKFHCHLWRNPMSTTPRVTFLLPTRNAAATIAATIDSILAQVMLDWELLVLDAASTDQTLAVVSRYRDARIRVVARTYRQPLAES